MRIADQKCLEKGTWDGSAHSSHLNKNVYKDKTCPISFCQWGRRLVVFALCLHAVTPIPIPDTMYTGARSPLFSRAQSPHIILIHVHMKYIPDHLPLVNLSSVKGPLQMRIHEYWEKKHLPMEFRYSEEKEKETQTAPGPSIAYRGWEARFAILLRNQTARQPQLMMLAFLFPYSCLWVLVPSCFCDNCHAGKQLTLQEERGY